ncbi:hypothetical protein HXX76_007641 [Chlamydomonas incerta]|nr:hypothetical protein HXX76_007641 [Chlamydomonas incerta]|eukprot:KAG2434753.1 hypothetical protein HXX76_007641 [Chlamydomonas incerta]
MALLAHSFAINVVAVLHTPRYSTFKMFDHLVLLGHSGATVFMGPPKYCVRYFRTHLGYSFPPKDNPADTLLDVITGKHTLEQEDLLGHELAAAMAGGGGGGGGARGGGGGGTPPWSPLAGVGGGDGKAAAAAAASGWGSGPGSPVSARGAMQQQGRSGGVGVASSAEYLADRWRAEGARWMRRARWRSAIQEVKARNRQSRAAAVRLRNIIHGVYRQMKSADELGGSGGGGVMDGGGGAAAIAAADAAGGGLSSKRRFRGDSSTDEENEEEEAVGVGVEVGDAAGGGYWWSHAGVGRGGSPAASDSPVAVAAATAAVATARADVRVLDKPPAPKQPPQPPPPQQQQQRDAVRMLAERTVGGAAVTVVAAVPAPPIGQDRGLGSQAPVLEAGLSHSAKWDENPLFVRSVHGGGGGGGGGSGRPPPPPQQQQQQLAAGHQLSAPALSPPPPPAPPPAMPLLPPPPQVPMIRTITSPGGPAAPARLQAAADDAPVAAVAPPGATAAVPPGGASPATGAGGGGGGAAADAPAADAAAPAGPGEVRHNGDKDGKVSCAQRCARWWRPAARDSPAAAGGLPPPPPPPPPGKVYLIRHAVAAEVTAGGSAKLLLRSNASRSHAGTNPDASNTNTNTIPHPNGGGAGGGLSGDRSAHGKASGAATGKGATAESGGGGGPAAGGTDRRGTAAPRSPMRRWWREVLDARRDVQLYWLLWRCALKAGRAFAPPTVLDMLFLQAAAFIVGAIQGTGWGLAAVPSNFIMAYLVLAVLSAVTHLRTFSANRTVQRYERMSGISVAASFAAAAAVDLGWVCLAPAVFMAIYYYLVLPQAPLYLLYTVGLMVCWWSSGLAYAIATSPVPPQNQLITTVIVTLILGAFLHGFNPSIRTARGTLLEAALALSYNRWAVEAATILEYREYWSYKWNEIMVIYYNYGLCGMDQKLQPLTSDGSGEALTPVAVLAFLRSARGFGPGACDDYVLTAALVLFGLGGGMRLLAYLQLRVGSEVLQALEAVGAAANKVARRVFQRLCVCSCGCCGCSGGGGGGGGGGWCAHREGRNGGVDTSTEHSSEEPV